MRIGICAYNLSAPRLLDIAVAADELGFDALWLGEHVVLPCGYTSAHPTRPGGEADNAPFATIVEPDTELLDPWVFLGAVAGATTRLRLATGIYIAPLRHPLATARAAVTAHDVSAGRFVLGVGSGWLREEFSALGVPFEERAARFDETVEILRRAWEGGPFAYQGTAFQFEPVQVTPRPVAIPLVLGGNSERALRRAATLGDGWFSSGLPSFDEAVRLHERLRALRERQPRADSFRCYFRADFGEAERLDRYEANGIDDVVFWAHQLCRPGADPCESLRRAADQLGVR